MISAVMPVYARADVQFERGEGAYLFDTDGRRYLDFASGIAVTALGHCHPKLIAALEAQAHKIWHSSNLFRVPGQEALAKRLTELTFADTVFFTNSGVEAWECGVKVVRRHFYAKGQPERNRIIVVEGAFHGRTMAAISAAKSEKMVKGFAPLLDGFDQVAFGNLNELRAAITPQTAAINIEPILGEGGIKAASLDYLRALRQIADEFGLLLYFDEIQTGMGRTGKLFAHEWAGIAPDVMAVAKAIGGGFPLGACLATENAASGMVAGTHGSTYGGNPLAMAVAVAALEVIAAPEFLGRVNIAAEGLQARLRRLVESYPSVFTELRGKGLMLGLRCADAIANGDMVNALRARGLITVAAAENVIRLLPPLIIGETEIAEAAEKIERAAAELAANPPKAQA
ncbi:MAG TPA: aspartate aminotransferase family protein [Alphaproteobacteria bacterium]|nr:aspartate aminotransferase family protein [Alphaproteobacteria bacterium]